MIIEETTQIGNPLLHRKSRKVEDVSSPKTQEVIQNLVDSMRHHNLIGMAGCQISEDLRIFVTEVRKTKYRNLKEDELRVYINPKITWTSDKLATEMEGCGSVAYAQLFGPVTRPEEVEVQALNQKGETFTFKASGMLARVIQHECDHLDGIEFIEKVTDPKTFMSSGEYKK